MPELTRRTAWFAPAFFALALILGGCKTSAEKAEAYYQSAMTLLQKGDEDRALIELRNVFDHNGFHKPARMTYAGTLFKRGEMPEAYSQYLRLIEQYPDMVEVRQRLAEMALDLGNWDEVDRHGRAALKLSPDQPGIQAIGLALDYRANLLARDFEAAAKTTSRAEAMLINLPNSLMLRRVVINQKMKGPKPQSARADIDTAIALAPKNFDFHLMRLRLLGLTQDSEGVGQQLRTMVKLFPDAEELKTSLIRWYMLKPDFKAAEVFLREQAGADTANPKAHLAVVQLLNTSQNTAKAHAELGRLIAANIGTANADLYTAFAATMTFDAGQTAQAIKVLDTLIANAPASDQSRDIMAMQARMLDKTGAQEQAATLVATILSIDPNHVDALKQRAALQIDADKIGEALIDLRTAQNQAPRDPQIMTLMATAYQRDGNPDLAGEQLAKAYEASNNAPLEALRYADHLRREGRPTVAEIVLTEARRLAPNHVPLLSALADVMLQNGKWLQAAEIAKLLHQIPSAQQLATQLDAAVLLRQNRLDEALTMLEAKALQDSSDTGSAVVVALTQLRIGKYTEARRFITTALQTQPKNRQLRLLSANVDALLGQPDKAETAYRTLIAADSKDPDPVRLLYGLLVDTNRTAEAIQVLDGGLSANPGNPTLLWIKANALEKSQDIDAAIPIYERIYAQDKSNLVAANNLASILSNHRSDRASLDRAATIGRSLRGNTLPAFLDTIGWINARRGSLDQALSQLEPAAKALPDDPLAQYHLGMVYADLSRKDAAIAQLRLALDLGKSGGLPHMQSAKQRLLELTSSP